jgi:hypothetical protein
MTRFEALKKKLTRCPFCEGWGYWRDDIPREYCNFCNGEGFVNIFRNIRLHGLHLYFNLHDRIMGKIASYQYGKLKKRQTAE